VIKIDAGRLSKIVGEVTVAVDLEHLHYAL
jgi:hypothetical protein